MSKSTQAAANNSRIAGLRSYLAGILPGLWQGDHVAETNHITGWNYVAITALARQCSQAHQVVWQTEDRRQVRKRLALLKQSGQSVTAEAEQPRRRRLDDSHPLVRLLDKPNAAWSGAFFRYSAIQQLKATGTALVWVRRNGFGVPVEMWVIPTALARPMPPSIEYPFGSYWVTPIGSWRHYQDDEGFTPGNALGNLLLLGGHVDAREVKPVRWPHPLYPSDGLAPMSAGSVFVDVVEQSWRQRFYSLKNSAVPGMVFTVDDEDAEPSKEDKEAFREQLSAQNAGTPNAGRFLIVPAGLKPDQMERSPVEMDYANSEEQLRDANLALYAVPPIACGISQAGSYAAFYAALLQMTELAVQPELDLLGEELTEELGPAYGPGRREIRYEAKRIDDPDVLDKQTRTESVVIDSKVKSGCYTVDEIRAFWGDEPVEDKEWGKQPAGVKRSEKVGAEQDAAPGTGDPNKPDETTTGVPDPVREAMPKSFEESKHPRADDGKFGEGSGNASEKPASDPIVAQRVSEWVEENNRIHGKELWTTERPDDPTFHSPHRIAVENQVAGLLASKLKGEPPPTLVYVPKLHYTQMIVGGGSSEVTAAVMIEPDEYSDNGVTVSRDPPWAGASRIVTIHAEDDADLVRIKIRYALSLKLTPAEKERVLEEGGRREKNRLAHLTNGKK